MTFPADGLAIYCGDVRALETSEMLAGSRVFTLQDMILRSMVPVC